MQRTGNDAERTALPAAYRVAAREDWTCFLVPYGEPPIVERDRQLLLAYLNAVSAYVKQLGTLHTSVWLQVTAFPPDDDTAQMPARYGRQWRPMMGLGVWPDRPAPRTWRPSDFTDRDWGTPLPTLMDSVLYLAGEESATAGALEQMFGTGCTMFAVMESDAATFHKQVRELLLARIEDPVLQHKPFYVPLLDSASVSALKSKLGDALPGMHMYARESKMENGVLLLLATRHVRGLVAAGLLSEDFVDTDLEKNVPGLR